MNWTDEAIAQLRAWWADGLPQSEIGRRLGCSKGAVSGKARRLDLPERNSIEFNWRARWTDAEIAQLRSLVAAGLDSWVEIGRQMGKTTEAARCTARRIGLHLPQAEAKRREVKEAVSRPIGAGPRRPQVAPVKQPHRIPRSMTDIPCCWPIGEPGTKGFRFCDAPTESGRSYCPDHQDGSTIPTRPIDVNSYARMIGGR